MAAFAGGAGGGSVLATAPAWVMSILLMNEVPGIATALIVVLVIVKPF